MPTRGLTEHRMERPFEGTSRFDAEELLGRGANGVVYRAFDRETGRTVALKTLRTLDAEQRYHLKTEFRALARIHHTNLVQLYELISTADDCFFTMELLTGETLDAYARRLAGGADPRELGAHAMGRLQNVFAQFVRGIVALHDAGKLHRDVKPTNLFVTEDERGVIVDFGLCIEQSRLERAQSPLVGTLLYMAPEQAWGKPLSPAADVYALGAVLYEALLGAPPFRKLRGSELLFAKENAPELPPSLPSVVAPLAKLAVEMMHPDPEKRPSTEDVLDALSVAPSSREPTSTVRARIRFAEGPHARLAPFVGRELEEEVLQAALADVKNGRPAVVDVQGASGIGKTELVERFLWRLEGRRPRSFDPSHDAHDAPAERSPDVVVLRGRCHPQESVSYNGFDGIVDDLSEWLTSLPESEAAKLLPDDGDALLALFPVLGRCRPFVRVVESPVGEPFALRQRALLALRRLLTKMGERSTVALFIDDVQWGGADTGVLLAEVLAPPMPRVLLVLSYRTEDAASSILLDVVRERAPFLLDSVHRVVLGSIEHAASAELATHFLADAPVDVRKTAERISYEAQGHPLYLRELALAATKSNTASQTPASLRGLLRNRIDALTPSERNLLALVSTAGRPIARRLLLSASGQGERGRVDVFALAGQRLLRESIAGSEISIEPYHSHVREAVLGALDDGERRRCHRALADMFLREPEHDSEGALVEHLVGASDLRTAAHFAEIAADRANQSLAFDRAAQLYRRTLALKSSASPKDLFTLRTRLAKALANTGRSVEAARTYEHAAREASEHSPAASADLERVAAEHYLRGGHFDEGASLMRRVLIATGVPYPSSALVAFGTTMVLKTKLSFRGMRFRARHVSEIPREELARIDACWSAGLGFGLIDRTRTAAFQARYMLLALAAGEPARVARGLATEASELACLGGTRRTARAHRIMDRAFALSDDSENGSAQAFNHLMLGTIEFYASRWRESLDHCSRASDLYLRAGLQPEWELLSSDMLAFACLAYLGELRTMRVKQAAALAVARERGNVVATSCLASGPNNITWLVADDPDEAERRADEGLAPWQSKTFQVAHYMDLIARVQLALYRGDAAAALDRLRREWPRLVTSMSLLVQNFRVTVHHLRGRAAIALATRSPSARKRAGLVAMAAKDAARLRTDDVAWSKALALSLEAGVAALRGNEVEGTNLLAEAAHEFRALHMHLHAAAADYERGRILGGDQGRALVRSSETWMIEQHVVSPERLAALLFPPVR